MAFKRSHHRAEFDGNLTAADIKTFIDDFYKDCLEDSLEGLIIEITGGGLFILEGDDSDVNAAMSYLDNASELLNNETYLTETSGAMFHCLATHMKDDARDITCS